MKKNNSPLTDDLIDLSYFFNKLWKRKITILIISVLFSFATYFYNTEQPKDEQYQLEVTIKDPPRRIFFFLESIKEINNTEILSASNLEDYLLMLQADLLSLDSLQNFVDQNKKIDNFKSFLKLKNISASQYFRNKFGQYKKDQIIIPNKYFMIYNNKLDKPEEFLSDYIKFVQKKNLKELKEQVIYQIEASVSNYEKALEIAKLIELTEPLVKSKNFNQQVLYEPMSLYYNGTKVLTEQIKNLKILRQKIALEEIEYNPFLDKPAISQFVSQIPIQYQTNPRNFAYFGFFLGFFVSLIIIFFRSLFK